MQTAKAPDTSGRKPMGYFVRPMRMEDIAQVARLERECFPTGWVATPFKRELRSRMAAYLVACEATDPQQAEADARAFASRDAIEAPRPFLHRLATAIKELFGRSSLPPPDFSQKIVGFVGLWFMADEAHITAIGVQEQYRRNGIGELLLLASAELAMPRRSRVITLEVRVSNRGAQAMYEKHGFNPAGIRKGYYTDNREDALIMTTDALSTREYRERLDRLREDHARRWGPSVRFLG